MSSEKSPEVVGCNASIMMNVWEIRAREYRQKMQLEQERMEKSALPFINQDWANRLAGKLKNYKRVEKKTKPDKPQTDNNIWKNKHTQVPPTLPRSAGSGVLGRPGGQNVSFSTQVLNYKDKKGQETNRLQLLMFITQSQPSAMVWGKSWKNNKCLPPVEGTTAGLDWGQCWMFATQQPYSEQCKPWPNGPNMRDPQSLHLWKNPDYRVMESPQVELSLLTEDWQMSWRKSDKNNEKEDMSSVNGENVPKSGFFALLVETQHHNELLCSSEWSESWASTKPASQQKHFTVPNNGFKDKSLTNKQDKDRGVSSRWEECWRLVNHHGCNKSKLSQVQKSYSPEWANSWRAAVVVFNSHKNSAPFLRQDDNDAYDHCKHKIILMCHNPRYRDLHLQLCNKFEVFTKWSKSWLVAKNNSKPSEEIEKVLNSLPPEMETLKVEENTNKHYLTSAKANNQVKHNVIYQSKREFTKSKLLLLKNMVNILSSSEWRDSWNTMKHRMRMERSMKPDPLKLLRESEKGQPMKPTASEWKDSSKLTCQPLHQEPGLWQQVWATTPQIRVHRAGPKNEPIVEQSWGESWRFSKHQYQQGTAQTINQKSSLISHHSYDSQGQVRYIASASDWQVAWMVSETQFHHDKPSLTQWRKAWKWYTCNNKHWPEQVSRENWVNELMEIHSIKGKFSLQKAKAKMSQSFDKQMSRERYPEKEWNTSWKAASLLNHQLSQYEPSGIPGKGISSTTHQQHATDCEHGSKWRRSFRLANPMPHMEKPWVESSPNPCCYTVLWSVGKNIMQNKININIDNNHATLRRSENSHQFLKGASAKMVMSKEPTDPRVIIQMKMKTRRQLCSYTEKEKQLHRKWAGCHLLGKIQLRPKKISASVQKLKMGDETRDKFFEDWADSWRFVFWPDSLNKQMPVKSLLGWNESWKFLLPPHQPVKGPKAK